MIAEDGFDTFIRENLRLVTACAVPEIVLWLARPESRLRRLAAASDGCPPYWAYQWAGGTALARFLLDQPETVAGRRVLDAGCGNGLVAIAAARAGAKGVGAIDIDPAAIAATKLNAVANAVHVIPSLADMCQVPLREVDLVLVGDVFYARSVARRVCAFLARCRAAGLDVLVGDPYRTPLPLARLRPIVEIEVPDFGGGMRASGIFTFG